MVSSSNNHSANSFLQAIEKTGSKDYIQHSTRPLNGMAQPNPDAFQEMSRIVNLRLLNPEQGLLGSVGGDDPRLYSIRKCENVTSGVQRR